MMADSVAKTRWCPFALVQSETKKCSVSGKWKDRGDKNALLEQYQTDGEMVAVAVINRTIAGEPHPDCLCITDKCVFWRKLDGTRGDCAKLDDNMNDRDSDVPDSLMEVKWCPHARPENQVVQGEVSGTISGCTIAISSANRASGGVQNAAANCISSKCMAYTHDGVDGYCMSADKNMQG